MLKCHLNFVFFHQHYMNILVIRVYWIFIYVCRIGLCKMCRRYKNIFSIAKKKKEEEEKKLQGITRKGGGEHILSI